MPVKVRVSYQKLLKYYVLNALKHRPPKGTEEEVEIYISCSMINFTKLLQLLNLINVSNLHITLIVLENLWNLNIFFINQNH